MTILFTMIVLTYICVMGLKIAMSEKMLLEKVGAWGEKKVEQGYKIFDLLVCPWCMGTLQVITAHAFAFGLGILPLEWNWQLVIRYPLIVMGSSLISGLTWTIYETINRIRERNEAQAKYYKNVEKLSHWDIKERGEKYAKHNHTQKSR